MSAVQSPRVMGLNHSYLLFHYPLSPITTNISTNILFHFSILSILSSSVVGLFLWGFFKNISNSILKIVIILAKKLKSINCRLMIAQYQLAFYHQLIKLAKE